MRTAPVFPGFPAIHAAGATDRHIDATFDLEARGGRPTWSTPPAISGGIRITLDAVAIDARLCFAGALEPAVNVTFTVTPDGRASDVVVETANARARDCLAGALRSAAFPMARRAWDVHYAFRL